MPNFVDLRSLVAEEIGNLHKQLDVIHQRFHTLADEWVQEASSQFGAGNNPLFGQAQHNAPAGHVAEEPSSTSSSSDSSPASGSSSSSSSSSDGKGTTTTTTTETKSSDTGSSGTSQPK